MYIPREQLADQECWQELRQWAKNAGLSWDKIRLTPSSITDKSVRKDEVNAAMALLRQGSFERVVFARLPSNYKTHLDWLTFAISCHTLNVKLENLEGELALPESANLLASSYDKLMGKAASSISAQSI